MLDLEITKLNKIHDVSIKQRNRKI